jgi:LacI family transcriptional regulator
MPGRITMMDVAREADVSLMTVSRVVNNKDGISQATRERVQDIINRLGYRPSSIARGLVTNRTGTLGLVVPDNANPFFSEVARGVEHVAYAEGYNVFLCNTEEDRERELAVLQSLEEKQVDGLIICSSRLDDAELQSAVAQHDAVILVNRVVERPGVGMLLNDDEQGGRLITQHLLDGGHRKIGFLSGPPSAFSGRLRVQGYRASLEATNVSYNPDWVWHSPPMVETGKQVARDMLTAHQELTALLCYNDLVAVGALQACAELGCKVPDDLAIVGFDDIPLAVLVTPPLTTCHVPRYDLGSQAMHMLLEKIEGASQGDEPILVQPKLVVRASAP